MMNALLQGMGAFETWENGGEFTSGMAQELAGNIDTVMDQGLASIETLTAEDANAAFVDLSRLIGFINHGVSLLPSIAKRLKKWVDRLRDVVKAIAGELKAISFSISVGFPGGVSVGLAFST